MQQERSRLVARAFEREGNSLITVKYRAQLDALTFFLNLLREPDAVGIIHGAAGSGKSTTVNLLPPLLARDTPIAVVDGLRAKPRQLLADALGAFGYESGLESTDALLKMLGVFAAQQARSSEAPILVVDNVDRMFPSALRTLNSILALRSQGRRTLRLLLTGRSSRLPGVACSGLQTHALKPLTVSETTVYLHTRLQAAGARHPDAVLPLDVCDQIFERSGGWPGRVDQCALDALAPKPPRLVVTRDGELLDEVEFGEKKILIGRSDFADIVIKDDFISKMHAVLILYSDALLLMDLNSANGTTVNSRKLARTVLQSDDVITLGHHRIKVENAPTISEDVAKSLKEQDTVRMKALADQRRVRARQRNLGVVKSIRRPQGTG